MNFKYHNSPLSRTWSHLFNIIFINKYIFYIILIQESINKAFTHDQFKNIQTNILHRLNSRTFTKFLYRFILKPLDPLQNILYKRITILKIQIKHNNNYNAILNRAFHTFNTVTILVEKQFKKKRVQIIEWCLFKKYGVN